MVALAEGIRLKRIEKNSETKAGFLSAWGKRLAVIPKNTTS